MFDIFQPDEGLVTFFNVVVVFLPGFIDIPIPASFPWLAGGENCVGTIVESDVVHSS
jgi:hypothetical protein